MGEVFTWNEGQVWVWTGSATASALVSFAQNMQLSLVRGWDNVPSLAGNYRDHITGRRADLLLGALYTHDAALQRIDAAETAVHVKLLHTGIHGSAGWLLWSGRIDSITPIGSEGNPYLFQLAYHANRWSAFGGG